MTSGRWDKIRVGLILVFVVGGLGAVLARCVFLQVFRCDRNRERVMHQQLKLVPQSSRRGMIVDRCGREMAMSTQVFVVAADPKVMADQAEAARQLSGPLNMSGDAIYALLSADPDKRYVRLKRDVNETDATAIRGLNLRGVICQGEYHREYPMGSLAAHVVGYTDIDGKGLEGVEAQYNSYLSGENGLWQLRSDPMRRPVGVGGKLENSKDGKTVVLTIDTMVQSIVEQELANVIKKFRAKGAIGVVMDPWTGEILAMASNPTFNPSEARTADLNHRRNRILTDPVEPGSVFKPFTASAAIEDGAVKIDQRIYCNEGSYSGKGFGTIREYEGHSFAYLTVAEILVRSSNIGSAKLAQAMGKSDFHRKMYEFGFGQKTGIDLPGEGVGIFPPLSRWNDKEYTLTRAAFGQAIAVTPMQLIRAFCSISNGGTLVRPHVVKGILSSDGGEVLEDLIEGQGVDGDDSKRVLREQVANSVVHEALTGVVARREGTANRAAIEGYEVFGKTGTANVPKRNGRGYEDNKFISSFLAGAPADHPRVCVLVMVHEPDRGLHMGYTGGVVAAPVVKAILEQSLGYLGVDRKLSEKTEVVKNQ